MGNTQINVIRCPFCNRLSQIIEVQGHGNVKNAELILINASVGKTTRVCPNLNWTLLKEII